MKILAALLLLSIGCFAQDQDRDRDRERDLKPAGCVTTSFTGNVKRGLPFVEPIGSGLSYRLAPFRQAATDAAHPAEFIGWTIEVAYLKQKGEMEREFSWVMTPPYRQWNARQLNTSYRKTIEEVLKAEHSVYFPMDILDYALADKMVTRILWRSSPPELHEAAHELPRIPVGSASLTIKSHELGTLDPKQYERKPVAEGQLKRDDADDRTIESLSFRVDLTLPTTVQLTPELARRARAAPCPVSPLIPLLHEMEQ